MIHFGMHETVELRAAVGRYDTGSTWIDMDGVDATGRPMSVTIYLTGGLVDRADAIAAAINAAASAQPAAEMPDTFVSLGQAADDVVRGVAEVLDQEVAALDAVSDRLSARRLELERGRSAVVHGDEPEAA